MNTPKTEHLGMYDGQAVEILNHKKNDWVTDAIHDAEKADEGKLGHELIVELQTTNPNTVYEFELTVTVPIISKTVVSNSTVYLLRIDSWDFEFDIPCNAKILTK